MARRGRPPKAADDEATVTISVRLPASLVAQLDKEAEQTAPGLKLTRTQIVISLLSQAIAQNEKKRAK